MGEVRSALLTVASSALFSLVLTALLTSRTPWLEDANGITLAWLMLASAPILHELAHRTVFRMYGVKAEIASPLRSLLSFGGAVWVPEPVHPAAALKGAVAGPLFTLAYTLAALTLSQWFKPLSLVAVVLSATVIASGAPFSTDAKYMNLAWRVGFVAAGAALLALSLYTTAYLIKYG
ncbi:MAG: hypothetical protein QXD32_02045 [Nitrososphaerota archaeon]